MSGIVESGDRLYVSFYNGATSEAIKKTINPETDEGASISFYRWGGAALKALGFPVVKVKVDDNYYYVNKNSLAKFVARHHVSTNDVQNFNNYVISMKDEYVREKDKNKQKNQPYLTHYAEIITKNIDEEIAFHKKKDKSDYVDLKSLMDHGTSKRYNSITGHSY